MARPKGQFSYNRKIGCGFMVYLLGTFMNASTRLFILVFQASLFDGIIRGLPSVLQGFVNVIGFLVGVMYITVCFLSMMTFNGHRWAAIAFLRLKYIVAALYLLAVGLMLFDYGVEFFFTYYAFYILVVGADLAVYKMLMHFNEGIFSAMDKKSAWRGGGGKVSTADSSGGPGAGSGYAVDAAFAAMSGIEAGGDGNQGFKPRDFKDGRDVGTLEAGKSLFDTARVSALEGDFADAFNLLDQAIATGFSDVAAMENDEFLAKAREAKPKLFAQLLKKAAKQAANR